jgi:hypothetical protein
MRRRFFDYAFWSGGCLDFSPEHLNRPAGRFLFEARADQPAMQQDRTAHRLAGKPAWAGRPAFNAG